MIITKSPALRNIMIRAGFTGAGLAKATGISQGYMVTIIVLNTAESKRALENTVFAAAGIAQKYNCALKRLDFQQEQGLMSSLPLGINQIEIKRGLTTSSTAIFVPFTTCELFQSGQALYYGLNALSNNLIMADRKLLKNPNALI